MRMRTCVLLQPIQDQLISHVRPTSIMQLTLLPGNGNGCEKGNARLPTAMMCLPLTSSAYRSHGAMSQFAI